MMAGVSARLVNTRDQSQRLTKCHQSGGSNLLGGAEVASGRLHPVNMSGDDDTYVRDAEEAELHHACSRKCVLVCVTAAAPPTGNEASHAPMIDLYNWSQPE